MTTERLDAILDLDRFAVYFRWAFCQKPRGKGIILASELLSTVFRRKRYYISENEAELLAGSNFDISSFRDLVATIGKKYLKPRSWQIKRKFFQAWRELAITQGQDLIAAAAFPRSYPRFDRFLVQPPVPEFLIETGYAENHCHFSAAGPCFAYNWFFLHNSSPVLAPLHKLKRGKDLFLTYYRETDYCRFYNLSLLAIYLRRFLFCQTSYRKKPELIQGLNPENPLSLSVPNYRFETMIKAGIASLPVASRSEHRMVDYACPARKNPLFAERVLLAACFRNYSKWSPSRQSVFLLYLVVRRYIAGFFVQNNMRYGFQNFKRYERLSDILIPKDSRVRNVLYEWTKQYLCEDSGLRKLEVRVAPKNTFTETVARIQAIQKTMHRDLPFHTGLVLHFIKNSRPINTRVLNRWSLPPRGYEDLSSYENQIGFVKRFAKSRWAGIHLVGIDAANEEIRCRPETFAPFFRAIGDGAHKKLFGLTFHVGEDFVTLMDGLRAIEEALIYLPLSAGDRLGHASALGTDIESYFTLKGKNIITTKQDALDDLSYLLRFVQKENRFAGFCSGVEKELNKLGKDIFGSVFSLEHYLNSQQLRTDHPLVHLGTKHYDDYSRAQAFWRIRGQGYYLGEIENKDYQRAWSDSIARELVRLYHESPSARAKGDELYHFEATKEYKSALSFVQEAIQTQLIERQIGIETNPTSNYLIGPYSDFSEIPFMRFSKINGLRITVGTDDPGLFYTNLQSEYAALFCYFSQETRESKRSIEKRFNKLAKDSLEMSFVSEYTSK